MTERPTLRTTLTPLALSLGGYAFVGSLVSFLGWPLDWPRLTDWFNDGVSIQPNACVLIMLSGAATVLIQWRAWRTATVLGALVGIAASLILLQYFIGADFGFNHQLLFGRTWGQGTTLTPGRVGPPASASLAIAGVALVILGWSGIDPSRDRLRRIVPKLALAICVILAFSLLGYLFHAREFYAIPWISAIALPTSTLLLAIALGLIISVPEHDPMRLLLEDSGAGGLARFALPALIIMIPLLLWLRILGYEYGHYDLGTGRALGALALMVAAISMLWFALGALRRHEEQLRNADRRKDEFLATLAHELRNPLAPIRSGLELLPMVRDDPEAVDEVIETMNRQTKQLITLVDDLVDVSRLTRGKLELRKSLVQLSDIVQSAVEASRPLIEDAGHTLEIQIPQQPVLLEADPHRLAQVISNLLNNAAKYTPKGGRIWLTAERQHRQVAIWVKDTGIGIPPERQDQIFELFAQIDSQQAQIQSGLGIGLTLVRSLVARHSGTVEVQCDGPGKGSTFCIRLPIVNDSAANTLGAVPAGEPQYTGRQHRVLVVDDNDAAAKMLRVIIEQLGQEVRTAGDGRAAVQVASEFRPQIILMDLGMPRMDGYEAAQAIRQQPWGKDVMLAALTGWNQDRHKQRAQEAGFDHHLVKPVDLDAIKRLLEQLERRRVAPVTSVHHPLDRE